MASMLEIQLSSILDDHQLKFVKQNKHMQNIKISNKTLFELKSTERNKLTQEALKPLLAQAYGLDGNQKFDLAFNLAWQYGHSSGSEEVIAYFSDLADLIK